MYRQKDGDYIYMKSKDNKKGEDKIVRSSPQESAARSPLCETTLVLLGGGSIQAIEGGSRQFSQALGQTGGTTQEVWGS